MDAETLLLIRREILAADIKRRLLARRRTTELDREIREITERLLAWPRITNSTARNSGGL